MKHRCRTREKLLSQVLQKLLTSDILIFQLVIIYQNKVRMKKKIAAHSLWVNALRTHDPITNSVKNK